MKLLQKILLVLLIVTITLASSGCGIKKETETKIIAAVKSTYVGDDLESKLQENIKTNPRFSQVMWGKFKWKVEQYGKASNQAYLVKYGIWGQYPWWKIGLGMLVEGVTYLVTLSFLSYNPWPIDNDVNGIYYTFLADFKNKQLTLLDKDPSYFPLNFDIDVGD